MIGCSVESIDFSQQPRLTSSKLLVAPKLGYRVIHVDAVGVPFSLSDSTKLLDPRAHPLVACLVIYGQPSVATYNT